MSDLFLDTNPSNPATPQAVKRTDLLQAPGELTLAEVSMFGAGTSNHQGVIALRTLNPGSSTGLVECMRIHTNGFVGIGTPSPTQALEVVGTVRATAFQGDGSALTGISDASKVSKAGDTMTGALNLPPNGLIAGTQQLVLASGNVGIGTTAPTARLQVAGAAIVDGDIVVRDAAAKQRITLDNGSSGILVQDADGNVIFQFHSHSANLFVGGSTAQKILPVAKAPSSFPSPLPTFSAPNRDGSIIVRDAANKSRIVLNGAEGDVSVRNATGVETIRLDGSSGQVVTPSSDCAEEFDVVGDDVALPGSVMVIGDDERLTLSTTAYDRRVAGVVSGAGSYRPGIVLDRRQGAAGRPAVALVGKVYCMVDADYGGICVGDLLVSSPTPGHAMAATDPARTPGAVLGKALRAWPSGRGLIPILVTLQ